MWLPPPGPLVLFPVGMHGAAEQPQQRTRASAGCLWTVCGMHEQPSLAVADPQTVLPAGPRSTEYTTIPQRNVTHRSHDTVGPCPRTTRSGCGHIAFLLFAAFGHELSAPTPPPSAKPTGGTERQLQCLLRFTSSAAAPLLVCKHDGSRDLALCCVRWALAQVVELSTFAK